MPGKRITDLQKTRFWRLTKDPDGPRLPLAAAARQLGISEQSAYRINQGWRTVSGTERTERKKLDELPGPKRLTELSTDGRAALADINLFSEMFFARRPSPWRYDAAMRIGEALLDREIRSFLDLNVFPGAGKTTLLHDFEAWIIAGGYTEDPAFGRALRLMLGSHVMKVAKHMVTRLRRSLELTRPYYDKEQRKQAEFVLALEYGRFKPDTSVGEEKIWAADQFLVAQLEEIDLYEKEPTVQAASEESGFLGERADLSVWDDIAVTANSTKPEVAAATDGWFEDEAETRVEPGGVMVLVGQRLSPLDLHAKRQAARVENEKGEMVPLYDVVKYPAHHDDLCDGEHRQWDPGAGSGCMTDLNRLSARDWMRVKSKQNYETVYQQEDVDPARILVQPAWLSGDVDADGLLAPGCYDRERGFWEWPKNVGPLVDYATLDPSAGNWWASEWWAVSPESRHNYLIEGRRKKIQAGAFLDWNNADQTFSGWMHEMQVHSMELGHPIRVWIIEAVAAHKYLFQFEHFRRWRELFPKVVVIAHQTQINKNDAELGVEGLMPGRYRTGMKHLPKKPGIEALNYLREKERELTTYPFSETTDTVMSDWVGEWNLDRIITSARLSLDENQSVSDVKLPGYLRRQQQEGRLE